MGFFGQSQSAPPGAADAPFFEGESPSAPPRPVFTAREEAESLARWESARRRQAWQAAPVGQDLRTLALFAAALATLGSVERALRGDGAAPEGMVAGVMPAAGLFPADVVVDEAHALVRLDWQAEPEAGPGLEELRGLAAFDFPFRVALGTPGLDPAAGAGQAEPRQALDPLAPVAGAATAPETRGAPPAGAPATIARESDAGATLALADAAKPAARGGVAPEATREAPRPSALPAQEIPAGTAPEGSAPQQVVARGDTSGPREAPPAPAMAGRVTEEADRAAPPEVPARPAAIAQREEVPAAGAPARPEQVAARETEPQQSDIAGPLAASGMPAALQQVAARDTEASPGRSEDAPGQVKEPGTPAAPQQVASRDADDRPGRSEDAPGQAKEPGTPAAPRQVAARDEDDRRDDAPEALPRQVATREDGPRGRQREEDDAEETELAVALLQPGAGSRGGDDDDAPDVAALVQAAWSPAAEAVL